MSKAIVQERDDTLPETVVRNRSQGATTLHRQDSRADEPRPACPEASYRDADFTDVPLAAYRSHYGLCQNPECFGGDWR